MARLNPTIVWNTELSTAELVLVCKALGGRLRTEDIDAAELLGNKLAKMRGEAVKQVMGQADQLLSSVERAEAGKEINHV